ncbi:MAG: 4'-phosphopantetheinyl transferase superfamily protein, partial [Acidimicrobiales bacterium]
GAEAAAPLAGVGVDFEPPRPTAGAALARLFCSAGERAWAGSDPGAVMRLWTAKEALFKANPANAGTTIADYRLVDPSRDGAASGPTPAGTELSVVTIRRPAGHLAVATCRQRPAP